MYLLAFKSFVRLLAQMIDRRVDRYIGFCFLQRFAVFPRCVATHVAATTDYHRRIEAVRNDANVLRELDPAAGASLLPPRSSTKQRIQVPLDARPGQLQRLKVGQGAERHARWNRSADAGVVGQIERPQTGKDPELGRDTSEQRVASESQIL
ncbi:unnamed protein product [Pseudo-nitzschia multistriata]|uniref:Uncharacterized protein n=1 Tax=Pseudo-nitzschia multistriata TaxID=183589 RepID=A0A448ZD69_9STRA|nr:unnamed protein product [Pseudo-nitzschia multistriata]